MKHPQAIGIHVFNDASEARQWETETIAFDITRICKPDSQSVVRFDVFYEVFEAPPGLLACEVLKVWCFTVFWGWGVGQPFGGLGQP